MESDIKSLPSPDDEYLDRTFGEDGLLARRFNGYRPRAGQIALARAVDSSIEMRDHLMAEAGTATGKSVAYLVPATYHAAKAEREILARRKNPEEPEGEEDWSKARVIVVTGGITLQEQLVRKDLPMLQKILPWDFTFSLLKGRSNFACVDSYYSIEAKGFEAMPGADEMEQIEQIQSWVRASIVNGSAGDVSELPFEPNWKAWRHFSVSASECKGSDCKFNDQCFSTRANKRARASNVIVTNYHMLLAHLQLRMLTGKDLILPASSTIIMDEAHLLADVARDVLGFRVTQEMFRRLVWKMKRSYNSYERSLFEEMNAASDGFFQAMREYKFSASYKTRIKRPLEESGHIHAAWDQLERTIESVSQYMTESANRIEARRGDSDKDRLVELRRGIDKAAELRINTTKVMRLSLSEDFVYFIDIDEKNRVSILSKPIHVDGVLGHQIFDKTPTVVCVSATLCVGESFSFIAGEVGCSGYAKLIAESPFAWSDQALLITPDDMPEPNDLDFRDAVAESVLEVVQRTRGRTLGLFTSRRNLEHTYEKIKNCGYRVMKQGEAPRTKLIEAFREDVSSVLLGTESFWAGVDIQGESLSAVVIDRLPFPTPDDPIADAIAERNPRGWFRDYAIPRSIIQFKQAFGRLIRSTSDAGVVVVLDRRIIDKPYGRLFIKSLPDVPVDRNLARISSFLRAS